MLQLESGYGLKLCTQNLQEDIRLGIPLLNYSLIHTYIARLTAVPHNHCQLFRYLPCTMLPLHSLTPIALLIKVSSATKNKAFQQKPNFSATPTLGVGSNSILGGSKVIYTVRWRRSALDVWILIKSRGYPPSLPGSYAYVHKSADPMTTAAFSKLLSKSILYNYVGASQLRSHWKKVHYKSYGSLSYFTYYKAFT